MAQTSFAKEFGALGRSIEAINARWGRAVFAPPMSLADVARVEARVGAALPSVYRSFVTTVSAGQRDDPDATGALLQPDAALALVTGNPSVSFGAGLAEQRRMLDALAAKKPREPAPHLDLSPHGLLPLRDQGDAEYDCLVLHGPLAGSMWSSWDAGVTPITSRVGGVITPMDFLNWVTRLVKEKAAGAPKPIDPAATRLTALDLARFAGIPSFVPTMTALEHLDLSSKPIDGPLPWWLARMPSLRALYAARCGLTSVGDWLASCPQLRELNLSDNRLRELPASIGACTSLEKLYVGRNALTALPAALRGLAHLRVLELGGASGGGHDRSAQVEGGNDVASLPDDLFVAMDDLRELRLSHNPLRRLPPSARESPLEIVELAHTPALDLVDALETLSAVPTLQRVILDGNALPALPPSVFAMSTVRRFSLIGTGLRALPDDVRAWENLEYLFLDRNALTALPDALGELPALKGIGLFGNPVPPGEVARFRALFPRVNVSI